MEDLNRSLKEQLENAQDDLSRETKKYRQKQRELEDKIFDLNNELDGYQKESRKYKEEILLS